MWEGTWHGANKKQGCLAFTLNPSVLPSYGERIKARPNSTTLKRGENMKGKQTRKSGYNYRQIRRSQNAIRPPKRLWFHCMMSCNLLGGCSGDDG